MVMSITAISKKVFPFIFDFTVGVSALISILSLEIVFGFFFFGRARIVAHFQYFSHVSVA